MIGMTSPVVPNGASNILRNDIRIFEQILNLSGLKPDVAFQSGVEFFDISLMMLGMMDLHGLGIDKRLQSIICIG